MRRYISRVNPIGEVGEGETKDALMTESEGKMLSYDLYSYQLEQALLLLR